MGITTNPPTSGSSSDITSRPFPAQVPLVGPVLAAQFGYLPGLIWLVIGVVLAGAVQDFLVLVCSMRQDGRSLAEIARKQIGGVAGWTAAIAVLFIIMNALSGLGLVVVKALGGETRSAARRHDA